MLLIDIFENGERIKTCALDYSGTTRSAMWNAFVNYWDRYFGWNSHFTWKVR